MRFHELKSESDTSEAAPRDSRVHAFVVAGLLLLFAAQAWIAALRDSVTVDEFAHLPVGLQMWRSGDLRSDPMNPPLARMILALPLLFQKIDLHVEPDFSHWDVGYRFMQENAANYQRIFVSARAVTILEGVLLGLLVFAWGRRLYGVGAGLIALFLYSLSPSMLAHSHLATLDLAGSLGFALTCFLTGLFLERPGAWRSLAMGGALGLAVLLKLSSMVLVFAIVLLTALQWARLGAEERRGRRAAEWMGFLALAALAALLAINLGYGFQGTFGRIDTVTLDPSGVLGRIAAGAPWLRLPVPVTLIQGIDQIMHEGRAAGPKYYLAGQFSTTGWWYYHLAAYALKTPIPFLAATVLAIGAWIARRSRDPREACLFVPVIVLFAANSILSSLNIGLRHVLAVEPLLCIAASKWMTAPLAAFAGGEKSRNTLMRSGIAAAALVWFAAENPVVAPRYLQYFNEFAGGPSRGHRWLIDSNLDWGQDLIRLREYMERERIQEVQLAYFGAVHPAAYGIPFVPLERGAHGIVVVSPTFLMGRPYYWIRNGEMRWIEAGAYTWMQAYEPIDRVGALFVYRLP